MDFFQRWVKIRFFLFLAENLTNFDLPLKNFLKDLSGYPLWFRLKVAQSQKVFHFGSNLQKKVPNHAPEHYSPKDIVLRGMIFDPFLGDFSQSEKRSEIEPSLPISNISSNLKLPANSQLVETFPF
jgi:hypothetical protein